MIVLATTLPENSNDGYVAAAYIVFFALLLVYVAIMAIRLGRVERKIEELRGDAETARPTRARGAASEEEAPEGDPVPPAPGRPREQETV
jgi:hypothetical protein